VTGYAIANFRWKRGEEGGLMCATFPRSKKRTSLTRPITFPAQSKKRTSLTRPITFPAPGKSPPPATAITRPKTFLALKTRQIREFSLGQAPRACYSCSGWENSSRKARPPSSPKHFGIAMDSRSPTTRWLRLVFSLSNRENAEKV
jgi:hypothetical protein